MTLDATAPDVSPGSLMGLAVLMKLAFDEVDLAPLGAQLVARATADPTDADALMDLSTILQLRFAPELALVNQGRALAIRQQYELVPRKPVGLRVLALVAPGNLMTNAPLEFLLEHSDVWLTMLYVGPELPFPAELPAHDVLFCAVGESDRTLPVLEQLESRLARWPRPVLNRPERVRWTSREGAFERLDGAPGVAIPPTVRARRLALARVAAGELSPDAVLPGGDFPVIIRPIDSHAGQGLVKLETRADLAAYLAEMPQALFYLSPYLDYRSADGRFRKYRVVLIDGRPHAVHLGISDHWMIHYLNAGMHESAEKRAEEAHWMASFDTDFVPRHAQAWPAIAQRMGLDYMLLDCAETPDGQLLVFEVDTGAVIHAMDPVALYPYKQPQMHRVFAAFRQMLGRAAGPAHVSS